MKKNDVVTFTITDMSHEGAGIGHAEGMTIFVNGAIVDDTIEAVIIKAKKNYCIGKLRQVIEPSPKRVEPKCPIAIKCGGCTLQQMDYDAQLELKEKAVVENLVRIGGFDRTFIESISKPIIGMDEPYRYRNKAQIPVGYDKDGNIVTGYYGSRSHRIIPMKDCIIGQEKNQDIVNQIVQYMKEYNVPAYDEETGKGLVRHILIREGIGTGEVMVCLIVNGSSIPHADVLADSLNVTSLCLNINTRRDNVILGEVTKVLAGKEYITDEITVLDQKIKYMISANSFYQVNHDQMEKLYSVAVDYANLTGTEDVWDLYCGIGTISLAMAPKAASVYGVEIIPKAIEDAKRNAKLNGFDNVIFEAGAVEDTISSDKKRPDVIVVDPPRKGCDEKCLDTIIKLHPDTVVYVSCDSATLSRDLKILCENAYDLKALQTVDQFCHSMHVESVVLITRKEK